MIVGTILSILFGLRSYLKAKRAREEGRNKDSNVRKSKSQSIFSSARASIAATSGGTGVSGIGVSGALVSPAETLRLSLANMNVTNRAVNNSYETNV